MSDEARKWTKSQLYAINCKEKDLLLSAGAGSGKTATLTERVCRLVCDEDAGVDVSRMLIVTFTKAAAEELRGRVRARLEEKLDENPASAHLARQIVALDGADISTISSFFLKSIKPYFSALGLPPSFGVADEATINVMKEKIMSDVIDDAFDEGSESFISLADALSSSRDEASMNAVVLSIADKMSAKGFSPERLAVWAGELDEDAGRDFFASRHGAIVKDQTVSFAKHYLSAFSKLYDEFGRDEFVMSKYGECAAEHIDYLVKLLDLAEHGDYDDTKVKLESFKSPRLPPVKSELKNDLCEEFKALKDQFKTRLPKDAASLYKYRKEDISAVQRESASALRALSSVIGAFHERFSEEKRRRGVVDYNDIETFAERIFVGKDGMPTAAAREVAKKYDCIFIDEYQDTNAVQDAVFSAIADNTPRFMVGDVKQSIYAFRGGEPSVFASYRDTIAPKDPDEESLPEDRRTLFMSENFRSDGTVIDFVNLVSEYMFPGTTTPFVDGDRLIFSRNRQDGYRERSVEVALIEKPPEDEADDEDRDTLLEAEYVAERVVSLLTKETRGDGTPYGAGDVAILLRSARYAAPFEEALKARGVKAADRATEEFFEQKEILLVLCLLNAIDNPLRDIYLAGAIKSPVFGFSLDEVIKIRLGKTDVPLWFCLESYAAEGEDRALAEKCAEALSVVAKLARCAKSADAASLVLTLYDELSLYSLTDGASPDSPRAASIRENLTTLYEMARQFESTSFGGLYGFISYLNERMEKSAKSAPRADDDAVSLLTIHKSKGLEFPVCFLGKCSTKFNMKELSDSVLFDPELGPALKLRDSTGLVKYDNPLRVALSQKMRYEKVSEELRVLYVAMTRAMERLVVCISTPDAEKAFRDAAMTAALRSDYSASRVQSFADVLLPAAVKGKTDGEEFFTIERITKSDIGFTKARLDEEKFVGEESADLTELYRERLSFEYPRRHLSNIPAKVTVSKLSPSLLDEYEATPDIDLSLSGSYADAPKKEGMPPLRLSDEKEAEGAERGTATHVFLQFCDFEKLVSDGFEAELGRLTEKRFLTRRMASLVDRNEIASFAESELFKEIAVAKKVWREFRFNVLLPAERFTKDETLAEKLRESGTDIVVQGVVDIVFETQGGRLILADYKTDRLTPYEASHPSAAKADLVRRHRSQLTYYKAACEAIFGRAIDRVTVYSLALGDTADVI